MDGDARHLSGAINRLRAAADAHQQPIDLHFAQQSLDDLIHSSRRPVRLPDIVEAVCDVFGVEANQLQSSSKAAGVTLPRILGVRSTGTFHGDDWIGLKIRDASVVRGIGVLPVFAGFIGLLLLLGSLALTWAREGR